MPFGIFDYHKSLKHLHIGCEAPRAYYIPFADAVSAADLMRDSSPYFKTLDGTWDFKFYKSIADAEDPRLDGIILPDKIDVPMNWQNAIGKGYDSVQYTNVDYPFPIDPPYVPEENPAALYSRTFNLTEDMCKRDVMLNFEGVDSCFYLFINRKFAGYSQVSHMTSEFNITDLVHKGENEIRVLVVKWCDGSYLEDQDMFRASGIFREVYILFRDKKRIDDVFVKCELSDDFSIADISAEVTVNAPVHIKARLLDTDNALIEELECDADGAVSIDFSSVEAPKLWSDETPELYALELYSGTEVIRFNVGCRRVEIKNKTVLINGKKVKAKGVNRHDSHPILGHATPMEHMKRDIMIMKANNINMVRTSHYPNDPRFLLLCDKYGLYVCDEADIECHGAMRYSPNHLITNNPEWQGSFIDRGARMLERDKNSPSIIMWSVGNECGAGINHKALYEYFKSRDKSRLVHVEDESRRAYFMEQNIKTGKPCENTPEYYRSYTEIESRMYPDREMVEYYLSKKITRPFFMCEYSHAMGNGPGDLKMYWDYIYKYDQFFGGCVWEMLDHSVVTGDNIYADPHYTYGGDAGEFPHFGAFCVDGLVYPDRRLHTGMLELKAVLKPFKAEYKNGMLKITSLRHFTSLSDLSLCYTVERCGEVVKSERIGELNIAPERSRSYKIDIAPDEYTTLNISVRQNKSTEWAEIGYEVGSEQFVISDRLTEAVPEKTGATLSECDKYYTVTSGETVYKIGRYTGLIESIVSNGKEMLTASVRPTIWRAPTDNDRRIRQKWEYQYFDHEKTNSHYVKAECDGEIVKINTELTVGPAAIAPVVKADITYTFGLGEGVHIDCHGEVGHGSNGEEFCEMPPLPRFGFKFRMPEGAEDVRYFGYGPYESYEDKRLASRMGLFKTTATENFEHYIRPQENSAHYGCLFADVATTAGHGLYFSAERFSLSVSHYDPLYLTGFAHDYELVPEKDTTVIIDYRNAGIGSNSCGPELAPEYRIDEKAFDFSFAFKPVFAGNISPFREYVK